MTILMLLETRGHSVRLQQNFIEWDKMSFVINVKNKNPIAIIGRIGELNFVRWAIERGYVVIERTDKIFKYFFNINKVLWGLGLDKLNKDMRRKDIEEIKNSKYIKKNIYSIFSKDEINFIKRISTKILRIRGGIPDYLIFKNRNKMFCEIKSNNAKLRETQIKVFSILSKKFETRLVKLNFSRPKIEFIKIY